MDETFLDVQEDIAESGTVSGNDVGFYQDVSGNSEVVVVPDVSGNDDVVYIEDSVNQSQGMAAESSQPFLVQAVNDDYVTKTDFYCLLLLFATLLCYLIIHDIFFNLFNMRRFRKHEKKS